MTDSPQIPEDHPLKVFESELIWRLVLAKVTWPKSDDDFEVLENVIATNWVTGPVVYIMATEGMRIVPIHRVWEVHIKPTNAMYKFMLQGMLMDAKSEGDRLKRFKEQNELAAQQLKKGPSGHG